MAIEGNLVALRVRYFKHDLEEAMRLFYKKDAVRLSNTAESDSLFIAYFEQNFSLMSKGDSLRPQIVTSGEDRDVWWYELLFQADGSVRELEIMNQTLFNLFDDQQNIFHLTHFPDQERKTLYFVRGSDRYTVTFSLQ
jgi:hypothetical protein